jgi:Tannase and feruloyl esterase
MTLWHGVHDPVITDGSSKEMYDQIVDDAGRPGLSQRRKLRRTQRWARFFPVPGIGNCANSVVGDGPSNVPLVALQALTDRTEEGKRP